MMEATIGFDLRSTGPDPSWTVERRTRYLLRRDVTAVRSVDPIVWVRPPGLSPAPINWADRHGRRAGGVGALSNWAGEGAWGLSASDTTARATAKAAKWLGAVTVTTLMIVSAVCTLMMLADRRDAAWSAATANTTGSGSWPPSRATLMMTS
jgi:hypothetical protein